MLPYFFPRLHKDLNGSASRVKKCKQAARADTLRCLSFLCAFIFQKKKKKGKKKTLPVSLCLSRSLKFLLTCQLQSQRSFLLGLTHPQREWGVHQRCLTLRGAFPPQPLYPQTGKQPGNIRRPLVSTDHSLPPSSRLLSPARASDSELALLMRRNPLIV